MGIKFTKGDFFGADRTSRETINEFAKLPRDYSFCEHLHQVMRNGPVENLTDIFQF